MDRWPHLYWAVYWIIINDKWEVLLLKRQNTGYFDGWYVFPAWHIEDWETSDEAVIREIKEEAWIDVNMEDIKPIALLQRIVDRQYFDVCYLIEKWSWKVKNAEPEKCSWVYWFSKNNLPEYMAPEIKIFLKHYFEFWEELKYYIFKK